MLHEGRHHAAAPELAAVDRPHRRRGDLPRRQESLEPLGREVIARDGLAEHRHAEARARRVPHREQARRGEARGALDPNDLRAATEGPRGDAAAVRGDEVAAAQIVGRIDHRDARRGHQHPRHRPEAKRDEALVIGRRAARTNGDVDAVADEVDEPIFEAQRDPHPRPALQEGEYERVEPGEPERGRRRDGERAVGFRGAHALDGPRGGVGDGLGVNAKRAPLGGELHAPRRPQEQRGADAALQAVERAADGRGRAAEAARGREERARFDDREQQVDLGEEVHVAWGASGECAGRVYQRPCALRNLPLADGSTPTHRRQEHSAT